MRKILFCLFVAFCAIFCWDICTQDAHSYGSGSPGGYSGSPSDGGSTCTSCHGGTASTQAGIITSDIPAEGYTPGSVYTLTISASYQNRTEYGFEMSANKASNTSIGGFVHTTTFTKAVNGNNATHSSTGTSAPAGNRTWTMNWTAPAAGSGTITFYLALNATNNNGSSSGDVIFKSTLAATEKPTACTIADQDVTVSDSTEVCPGFSSTISVANSEVGVSYQLQNAGTSANIGIAKSGTGSSLSFNTGNLTTPTTFKVLATKSANCTLTLTDRPFVDVALNPTATVSASGPLTFCQGDSVVLTSSTGQSYTWSNGKTTQSIVVKTSGTYHVTVHSGNGCESTSTDKEVTVQPLPIPQVTPKGLMSICDGDSIKLSTGNFSTYKWSNGKTTKDIYAKTSGAYTVKVGTPANCEAISADTAYVTVFPKPNANITLTGNDSLCPGDSVKLSVPTTAGATYLWSNGATSTSIVVKTSGTFSVKVSTSNCSTTSETVKVVLTELPDPVLNLTGIVTVCIGESVLLKTKEPAEKYLWSNGSTDPSITVATPGKYMVTVSNSLGCSKKSDTVTVMVGTGLHPIIDVDGQFALCSGQFATLTTQHFDTYKWSNGFVDSSITINKGGKYFVEVTKNGCKGSSDTLEFTEEPNPVVHISPKGIISGCDSIFIEATVGNFSYLWNTGEKTRTVYGKTNGFHFVTAISSGGCEGRSDSVLLSLGKMPHDTITFDGTTFTSSSATGNQWFRGATKLIGETGVTYILGPIDGDYYCVVTDDSGICSDTSNVIKINRSGINSLNPDLIGLYPNPAKDKLTVAFNSPPVNALAIFNLLGEEILHLENPGSPTIINTAQLSSGTYILKAFFNEGVINKRFTIQQND